MPSSSPTHKPGSRAEKGCLYVVATPMGNLEDITLRALGVLQSADIVAAEDTRKTGRLLARYQIRRRLISYHEHNEQRRAEELVARLEKGEAVALVSDAGTPGISDPGYRLVTAAVRNGIQVVPIPGVSAVAAALSVAGLPTDGFVFAGFAPKKRNRRRALLEELAVSPFTVVFYESPLRIVTLLGEIRDTMGNRDCVVAREMTKVHEEFLRGPISEVIETSAARSSIKGECTLLIAGNRGEKHAAWEDIQSEIGVCLAKGDQRPAELAKAIAGQYGITKRKAYDEILRQQGGRIKTRRT